MRKRISPPQQHNVAQISAGLGVNLPRPRSREAQHDHLWVEGIDRCSPTCAPVGTDDPIAPLEGPLSQLLHQFGLPLARRPPVGLRVLQLQGSAATSST